MLIPIILIVKSILHYKKYTDCLLFQWILYLLLEYLNYFFSERLYIPIFSIFQIILVFLPNTKYYPTIEFYQSIPIQTIEAEIKFYITVGTIQFIVGIFKRIMAYCLSLIDEETLNDVRQSKLQQSLLDVSQFIDANNFNNRQSYIQQQSQFVNQSMQLDLTQIHEEKNINQSAFLQEIDSPLFQTTPKKSEDDLKSSMKNILEQIKSERKAYVEPQVIPKCPAVQSFRSGKPPAAIKTVENQNLINKELFQKLQQCKQKITQQQSENSSQLNCNQFK